MGDFDQYVGELVPGQKGWLPISAEGEPIGPATVNPPPPGPDVFVCAVMVNPQVPVPDGDDLLLSASGAKLESPLQANPDPRDEDIHPSPVTPTISALTPNTAVIGDPDVDMRVTGTGFAADSVIVWNGADERTDYYSETELGTIVKPSMVGAAISVPVAVRNGTYVSNSMDFSFTEPVVEGEARRETDINRGRLEGERDRNPKRR